MIDVSKNEAVCC